MTYYKFPRIYHLPWSPNLINDDRKLPSLEIFEDQFVVATLKLDGENTTMYRDHIHARSLDSKHHISRSVVKQLHGTIQHRIPEGYRICGENMYAKHSIHYTKLTSYFYVFSIWNDENIALPWDHTKSLANEIGLETVPELYVGKWDEGKIKALEDIEPHFGNDEEEGYVVRFGGPLSYPQDRFFDGVAKYVRKGHVQTDQNWMTQPVVPNELI